MTSNVKRWLPIFCIFFILWTASIERAGARKRRRVSLLLSVGWLPPAWRPSGACLARGTRVGFRRCTPARVPPHRGGVSSEAQAKPRDHRRCMVHGRALGSPRDLLGQGPPPRPPFPREGANPRVGLLPSGAARAGACAAASRRLPTDLVERLGSLRPASGPMPAAVGGGARGPGACDQGPAGRAMVRRGAAARWAPRARRVGRGGAAPGVPPRSRGIEPGAGAAGGHRG